MSLFGDLFSRADRPVSRLLIDVGPASVAGACAFYAPGKTPVLCYDKRVSIIVRVDEPPEAAMERALDSVCEVLGKEGAAALARVAGNGRINEAVVSIDAPWQQTIVHMEEKREERPFTFTRRIMAEILERSRGALVEDPGRTVEQHVVGIRLNGYESVRPFGQAAHRAALIILISWIQSRVVDAVNAIMRARFHLSHPSYVSGPTLRYRVLSKAFPHEQDMLILDAASHTAVLSLVKSHTLVAVQEFPGGENEEEWVTATSSALKELAAIYPLPPTILLVADGAEAGAHVSALESAGIGALWLSDNPPKIIPVSRIPATQVTMAPETVPDIRLALMARYAALPPAGD
jgi:hypothetical protein